MEFAPPSVTLPNIHHLKPLNINSNTNSLINSLNHASRISLDSTPVYHLSPSFHSAANSGQESMVSPPSSSVSPGTGQAQPQNSHSQSTDYVSVTSHSKKSGLERSIFTVYLQPNVPPSTIDQLKFTIAIGNHRSNPYSIETGSNNPNKYAVSVEVPAKLIADVNASPQSETKVPVYLIIVEAQTLKDIGSIYVCDFTYEDYHSSAQPHPDSTGYPYQPQQPQQLKPPSPPHSQTYLPLPTLSNTPRINGQPFTQPQPSLKTPTPSSGDVTPLSTSGYSSYYRAQQQKPLPPQQQLQRQPQNQTTYYYGQSSPSLPLIQPGPNNSTYYPQYIGNEEPNPASYYDPVHGSNINTQSVPVQEWNSAPNTGAGPVGSSTGWHSNYASSHSAPSGYGILQDPNTRQPLVSYGQSTQPPTQQYQMYQADHRMTQPSQVPQLVRTTALSQAASSLGSMALGSERHLENDSPFRASLEIMGNLNDMATNWSVDEWRAQRRLVQFRREQRGPLISVEFSPLDPERYTQNTPCISCIHWAERNECFVTSVDCIYLLEQLVNTKFKVEEKNRIRRNLEGYHPLTVSKGKPESGEFFKLIMSFTAPKPRNIEKDVKVFPWRILASALKKIIGKYSADYSSTGPMGIRR